MERPPQQQELIETPNLELTTKYGRLDLSWLNACLVMTDYPLTNNYLEYTSPGGNELPVMVTDKEWQMFSALEYPWIYVPDAAKDSDDDKIYVNYGKRNYWFHRHDTGMRMFKDSQYNHVEHSPTDGETVRLPVGEDLWRKLFEDEFAIKWLPYTDPETSEWFHGKK